MKDNIFTMLKWELQSLAQPAEVQLSLFDPKFAHNVPDELALSLDDILRPALTTYGEDLTEDQRESLCRLDVYLRDMSGQHNADLWTVDALRTSDRWNTVRELARHCLDSLGWDFEVPPRDGERQFRVKGQG
jgi:hypothetical protein